MLALLSARIENRLRLLRARRMHKTVRFKVGDLHGFYEAMNASDIPYCVLRWADAVPFEGASDAAYSHDVDHLIGRHVIAKIYRMASARPGRAKCDFYSINGERGSAYARMPYLTPALAAGILERRVRHDYPFYVPCAWDAFFSFAFHLVYHKGIECGVATGLEGITPNPAPARDYLAELLELARLAQVPLRRDITLLGLHNLLRAHQWNMPLDLMVRWPRKHAVLRALIDHDEALLAPLVTQVQGLYVFVLRSQSRVPQNQTIASEMIATRFDILDSRVLSPAEVTALSRLTRGGNWYEKSHLDPIPPTDIIVCRERTTRGPLPDGMSAEKVAKRYPHILNTDVLIKRDVRSVLRRAQSNPQTQTSVHATDNPMETAETLQAVMGDGVHTYLTALQQKG